MSRPKKSDGALRHPTARALVDVTKELLQTVHMDDLSIAMVLENAGVSHGSLYHHFSDFAELVETAVVERYDATLAQSLEAVRQLADCRDAAEFRRRAEDLIRELHAQQRRPARLVRLEALGASVQRPRLAERLAESQSRNMQEQALAFADYQSRGWMRADLDPSAMSTFMMSTFLGRTVDDMSATPVDADKWVETVLEAARAVLFPPSPNG